MTLRPYKARFDFFPEHGVQYPKKGAIISRPQEGKVRVPNPIFKVGLRLPTVDFFDDIMCKYGLSMDNLTPNIVNKIVGFELACRALECYLSSRLSKLTSTLPPNMAFIPSPKGGVYMHSLLTIKSPRGTAKKIDLGEPQTWLFTAILG